jgi:hypothetical protein
MKRHTTSIFLLAIGLAACASNDNGTFINEDGQECRVTYNQIYQPPVTVGGAGSTISVPGDTICTDPESPKLPPGAIIPTPDEAVQTVKSMNQAQRTVLSFFESTDGPNLTCEVIDRGENRLEAVECQKTSDADLCLRGVFEEGKAENLERCFTLPAQLKLFDTTKYDLGKRESHLLQSWAVWGAEDDEALVYNVMFASLFGGEWQPRFAGFGQPPEEIIGFMSPTWLNRPEAQGRIVPKERPELKPED